MRSRPSSISMSRHPQRTRATLTLVLLGSVALTAPLLASCGARTAEKESTNTGNPPFIDHGEISIELVGDKVKVTGGAGAVSPGGVEVEVINLSTNETAETKAKANGAFEVELNGQLDDGYSVKITNSEGEANLTLSLIGESNWCAEREPMGSGVAAQCWHLFSEARCQAIEAVVPEFLGCETSDDCEWVPLATSCNDSCDRGTALAKTFKSELQEALVQVDERVCGERASLDCDGMSAPCAAASTFPACVAGRCALVSGCIAGAESAGKDLAKRLPELAEGCSEDVDCRVELPAACDWGCPVPAYVASVHQTDYDSLLGEIAESCALSDPGASGCPALEACPPTEATGAVCREGTCVAGDPVDLEDAIQAEIDRLNTCEEPEDCEAIAFPNCKTSYISAEADRSTLDSLLESYPTTACDGSCACGILECVENRCTTRAGDCMTAPEGALMTCL